MQRSASRANYLRGFKPSTITSADTADVEESAGVSRRPSVADLPSAVERRAKLATRSVDDLPSAAERRAKTAAPSVDELPSAAERRAMANASVAGHQPTVADSPLPESVAPDEALATPGRFTPEAVQTLADTGLPEALVESLVYKILFAEGNLTSRDVARAVALPGKVVNDVLSEMKMQQFAHFSDSAELGDFEYALTEAGRTRARLYMEECAYVGPAPVPLETYIKSVGAQGITTVQPKRADLERAFGDLLIDQNTFDRLGPAINSGRGLFLYGFPGNGKTSIAERITDCFGDSVWIPYAITCGGDLITLFDPQSHLIVDGGEPKGAQVDPRWVRIRRPTIVAGGELAMDALDLCHNHETGISEASLQLKSNTGTLVIDDFGRQRMRPIELLNRWIVPLEKRHDYLALSTGKKIRVPFDQLIIFSTNLEPKDLVDEAFLRRIPYKIQIVDPTEEEFRRLFDMMAPRLEVEIMPGAVDHLIERHYKAAGRPFRCCQPRDLLMQIRNNASYGGTKAVATARAFDLACGDYFAIM
jgi:predicted ATPase with chaperone activity